MRQPLEVLYGLVGALAVAAHEERGSHGRHDVVEVVHALQPEPFGAEAEHLAVVGEGDEAVAVADPFFELVEAAHREELRFQFPGACRDQRVIDVQDGVVVGTLVLEDAELRVDVLLEAVVAIQVVFGQVQKDGDVRPEALDPLELEGGEFDHDALHLGAAHGELDEWIADVPADEGVEAASLEDLAGQRGRGGLAVGPGDGDHRGLDEPGGELHLGDHAAPLRPCHLERLDVHRDAGGDDDQVGHEEAVGDVTPKLQAKVEVGELGEDVFQRLIVTHVGDGHLRPGLGQKAGHGDAGLRETYHQYFLVL